MARPRSQVADNRVAIAQRGALRRRQLASDIIEVDAAPLPGNATRGKRRKCEAPLDLEAAFPSINHSFIRAAPRAHDTPEFV
eukprot:2399973-Pyramimonas_sp.AAC.2